jgi:Transglycosylase SLT domain
MSQPPIRPSQAHPTPPRGQPAVPSPPKGRRPPPPQADKTTQFVLRWLLPAQLLATVGGTGLLMGVMAAMLILLAGGSVPNAPLPPEMAAKVMTPMPTRDRTRIARTFTKEVQFWSPYIMVWAQQYNVDPDILATVIQIESCGHYLVNSPAGAQGLFQVMPFHFQEGENPLDPEINAKRGINYLIGSLRQADGHIGLAMAGYNGGWGVIPRGWNGWVRETRNYYTWGSTIYLDALQDKPTEESAALQSWLNAGGSNLCALAAQILPTPAAP